MDWLELGYERSDPNIPYIGLNTKNSDIRHHPRLKALLRKMGLDYWADNP
jgi:hypothetical protein